MSNIFSNNSNIREVGKEVCMFDVVFVDFDGTLTDDSMRHYRCYCDIINDFGGNKISYDEYWNMKRMKSDVEELLIKSQFRGSYQKYYHEWIMRIEKEAYLQYEILRPGVHDVLALLKIKSKKLVLVSMRNNEDALKKQLQDFAIIDFFDEIIVGNSQEGKRKKDLVFERGGKYLVLGDTEDDMCLADTIGAQMIAITSGVRDRKFLNAEKYVFEIRDVAYIL